MGSGPAVFSARAITITICSYNSAAARAREPLRAQRRPVAGGKARGEERPVAGGEERGERLAQPLLDLLDDLLVGPLELRPLDRARLEGKDRRIKVAVLGRVARVDRRGDHFEPGLLQCLRDIGARDRVQVDRHVQQRATQAAPITRRRRRRGAHRATAADHRVMAR